MNDIVSLKSLRDRPFELLAELERAGPNGRGDLEMVVRETLEALALG